MALDEEERNFVMLEDGQKTKQFTSKMPRQAALKAARRLEGYDSYDAEPAAKADPTEIRLLERGTDRVHVYHAWAWIDSAPDVQPDWMKENDVSEVRRGNVSKQGIEHIDT